MSDEPIEEMAFLSGVTVVDIGDIRVSRGLTRRPHSSCNHRRMSYDPKERRIWCRDCEKDVDQFDAFVNLTEQYHRSYSNLKDEQQKLAEAQAFQIRSVAAKNIDKAWRSKSMVPACPSCGNGLFPEDFRSEPSLLGKEYAAARRKRKGRSEERG